MVIVDRPGAPQSEIRVGHVGAPRRIDDFHALSVMNAMLGGLFNSRLNMLLREERGYTYGVNSGFDLRRAAGPFAPEGEVGHLDDVTHLDGHGVADLGAVQEGAVLAPQVLQHRAVARDHDAGVAT